MVGYVIYIMFFYIVKSIEKVSIHTEELRCWSRNVRFASMLCLVITLALIVSGCSKPRSDTAYFAATCPPVAIILREVVGERTTVECLMPAGVSPHTYEIRPSDARRSEGALALFYIDDLYDGWAAGLPARERIPTFPMVDEAMKRHWDEDSACTLHDHGETHEHNHRNDHADEHDHGDLDPHYWADPLAVASMLPVLTAHLCRLDPEGCETYEANAAAFNERLEQLHDDINTAISVVSGGVVALFHPSWIYYTDRYGIEVAALVEPYPGQEASPRYIRQVIDQLAMQDVGVVFTEPQLPRRPAEVVSEAAGIRLMEIDPVGGARQTNTYEDLLWYNTHIFIEALQ